MSTVAISMFYRKMEGIAAGERPGRLMFSASKLWASNPGSRPEFVRIAFECGVLKWDWRLSEYGDFELIEATLFDVDIRSDIPVSVFERMALESSESSQKVASA